ncbi:MAG TPA: hypothetical protein VGB67_08390 [Fibrella sp.]
MPLLTSLDPRSKTVDAATKLHVQREQFSACLVKLSDDNFLNTLRSKLN